MNHANLKALMLAQNNHNNKLYYLRHTSGEDLDALTIYFYSGAEVVSRPDKSWTLTLDPNTITMAAIECINMLTSSDFVIKKHAPRKFSINGEDFIGNGTIIDFDTKGDYVYTQGIISGKTLKEGKKDLHKLTRRIRKKVQPQLRLLGTGHFQKKQSDKDHYYYAQDNNKEVKYLIKLLDGEDIIETLDKLRVICDMDYLFGNGHNWALSNSSEFQPKKIIDKILRRVGANKITILEKYDERKRNTTTGS